MFTYEYKFVKIGLSGMASKKPEEDYHNLIEESARQGWRLVQIFAPAIATGSFAAYFELIFEKAK